MTRCGLILSVTVIYITFFEAQKGLELENFVQRMVSQNERNPYVLYNQVSKKVIINEKTWVKVEGFSGGWWGNFFLNVSVKDISAYGPGDLSIDRRLAKQAEHVLKIKVASLFRRNIIKAFGYILHRPNMELNSELYTSLYFIHTSLKLNHLDMISMVSILSGLAFKTSNERFLDIFSAMEKHLPVYLKCSATVWREAIQTKVIDMDVIFQPTKNSPLIYDILYGMNQDLLNKVTTEHKVEDPITNEEKDIFYNMNINILEMMRHVKDIQPTFLGALIQFFPRTYIQPNLEESVAVVAQYFDQNKIEEWEKYVSELSKTEKENPYDLVMQMFDKLKRDPTIPKDIGDAMAVIQENLFRRNPAAINPHYSSISSLVIYDTIKLENMLNYVPRELFPLEVVVAAERTRYYYDTRNIRRLNLMQHFNPYIYRSPTEMFLALLVRILKRQPDLPLEINGSAGAVYSHLLVSYRHVRMPIVNPGDIDIPVITNFSLRSPEMDTVLWEKTKDLHLQWHSLAYQKFLEIVPVYRCATPLLCYVNMLEKLQKYCNIINKKTVDKIKNVIEYISHIGPHNVTVKATDLFNTTLGERAIAPFEVYCSEDRENTTPLFIPTTATEGEPHSPTTAQPTPPIVPTTFSIDTRRNDREGEIDPITIKKILNATCQQATPQTTKEVMSMILTFDAVKSKLNFSDEYLVPIIHSYVKLPHSHKKPETFLHFVNNFKPYDRSEMLKELEPTYPLLSSLIDAIPPPVGSEWSKYLALKQMLAEEHLFKGLKKDLKTTDYKNVATLLTAILKLEMQPQRRRPRKQREAAEYYIDKVRYQGVGQAKVPWGVHVEVFNKTVDIALMMNEALNYAGLDTAHQGMFKAIVQFMKQNPHVLKSWNSWGIHRSAGEFTEGLFQHIRRHEVVTKEVKNAIEQLRGRISFKTDCKQFTQNAK